MKEPIILGFLCNWCSYAAADLAGVSRFQYPANLRIIRVPCTGEVDVVHILRAFENGVDGVIVSGCLKEQCHYTDGNIKAEERVAFAKKLLKAIGFGEERLEMFFMSASMGGTFVETATDFTNRVKKLGPSPVKKSKAPLYVEGEKRKLFIEQLKKLATKNLDALDFVVEEVEGFGKVEIDANKCTGCGSCANICDAKAMKAVDSENNRRISFTQAYCVACKKCEEQCDEKALKVSSVFDLKKILSLEETVFKEAPLLSCVSCGIPFAPEVQVKRLEESLKESLLFCPGCRSKAKAEKIAKMVF